MDESAELIRRLGLTGLALILLASAEIVERSDQLLRLRLPRVKRHLAGEAHLDRLLAALRQHFGNDYSLIVEIEYS